MEDLEDLDLSSLEELQTYERDLFWPELVLYASILLKCYGDVFPDAVGGPANQTEQNNQRAEYFFRWAGFEARDLRSQLESASRIWIDDKLPDVCGACFFSFGTTISGRYRLSCPKCEGKETRLAFDRVMALHRYCMHSAINEAVLCQLIYKYYSPNGDPTWVLAKYNPLI